MRVVSLFLVLLFILCSFSIAVAGSGIPNLTLSEPEITGIQQKIPNATVTEETNGRPQHLDEDDRSAQELNPVEVKIIRRDTIQSNRQTSIGSEAGQ
jgi:hypothetical protein